jgi:hypothetical protein
MARISQAAEYGVEGLGVLLTIGWLGIIAWLVSIEATETAAVMLGITLVAAIITVANGME